MSPTPLLIILGATASGKTKLAVNMAAELNGEIISADSRQLFEGMNIGTGKDLDEYLIYQKTIPYHLIDIKKAGEKYNVNEFKEDFYAALEQISIRRKLPILCGGTGMYIHSILQNHELTAVPIDLALRNTLESLEKIELIDRLNLYPGELTEKVDHSSKKRLIRAIEICEYLNVHPLQPKQKVEISPFVIGLKSEIEVRRSRILHRLDQRLKSGLIEEVEDLLKNGVTKEMLTFYGLEYKFVVVFLSGEISYDKLRENLGVAICQFAKRQMTFFRKMEKDGVKIHWLDADLDFPILRDTAIKLAGHLGFR